MLFSHQSTGYHVTHVVGSIHVNAQMTLGRYNYKTLDEYASICFLWMRNSVNIRFRWKHIIIFFCLYSSGQQSKYNLLLEPKFNPLDQIDFRVQHVHFFLHEMRNRHQTFNLIRKEINFLAAAAGGGFSFSARRSFIGLWVGSLMEVKAAQRTTGLPGTWWCNS